MGDDTDRRDGDRGAEGRPGERDAGMHEAVTEFLAGADDVYDEYDRGYLDADAALSVLSSRVDDLRDAADGASEEGRE